MFGKKPSSSQYSNWTIDSESERADTLEEDEWAQVATPSSDASQLPTPDATPAH